MAVEDRRFRDRTARRRLITATARVLAEREGWDAVTTRRLSSQIEYSQPVIYKHFASMEDLVEAIALEGFDELTKTLGEARRRSATADALGAVARAYCTYATENPALYDAMFTRATHLRFGAEGNAVQLSTAVAALRAAAAPGAGERDVDILAEVLWAALHGLVTLGRNGRLRPGHDNARIDLLVAQFRTASLLSAESPTEGHAASRRA